MVDHNDFYKVFTKRSHGSSVVTLKSEEKYLADDQYLPPPGNISLNLIG